MVWNFALGRLLDFKDPGSAEAGMRVWDGIAADGGLGLPPRPLFPGLQHQPGLFPLPSAIHH